jgi:hypothetical protein
VTWISFDDGLTRRRGNSRLFAPDDTGEPAAAGCTRRRRNTICSNADAMRFDREFTTIGAVIQGSRIFSGTHAEQALARQPTVPLRRY